MNVTENVIEIAAPAKTIYDLAAATDRWPLILPHYRYVRTRAQHGATRIVEMAAWRDAFPLRWVAEQTNDPVRPHIFFHHIEGPTRGMDVEWLFEPVGRGTRVTIVHRLEFQFPIAAAWLGEHVVGDYFIAGVAHKTLARIKVLAEATESAA
jgi:ribosome-associated toxin RatA of RatAB toxin-antitoxin module